MKKCEEKYLAKLVKKYGLQVVQEQAVKGVPDCGPGKIWNPLLQRCVDDIG